MIYIEICPAFRGSEGYYRADGHASKGKEAVCAAVTAIEECLAANLDNTWNIKATRTAREGSYALYWRKTDRKGAGIRRSNDAAGFAYNGLRALERAYPDELHVIWKRPDEERRS